MFFSPRAFLILTVLTVLVFGIMIVSKKQTVEYESEVIQAKLDEDTDNDGLLDWEETLWQTSVSNPDTDNDGVRDGEEVKNDTNPLKAGLDGINNQTKTPTITKTEEASREFFAKYLLLKQSGATFDTNTAQTIADSIAIEKTKVPERIIIPVNTVKTSSDTSKTAVFNYGNALGKPLKTYAPKNPKGELAIFLETMQEYQKTENGEGMRDLNPIIDGYRATLVEYRKIVVPSDAVNIHAEFLSVITNLIVGIEGLAVGTTDPIRALSILPFYITEAENLQMIFRKLDTYFLKHGVSFKQGDDGYTITGSI